MLRTLMNAMEDRRMWSITAKGLYDCLSELFRLGIPSCSVRDLQKILRENKIYPARDFAYLCSEKPPDAFFTYESRLNYVEVQEIVWKTFDFTAKNFIDRNPGLMDESLERLISRGIRLWVDFIFINQSARNINEELEVLPKLLDNVDAHFVLGETPLERAWCCYEIALYNRKYLTENGVNLRSFVAPSRTIYHGWELVVATEANDKLNIERSINNIFPKGFEDFTMIMNQANAVSAMTYAWGNAFFTPDSLDSLNEAMKKWYERFYHSRTP